MASAPPLAPVEPAPYIERGSVAHGRLGAGAIALLVISALAILLELWGCVSPFVPHTFYGMSFRFHDGVVRFVYPNEPNAANVRSGDRVLDLPHGDVIRGYRLASPRAGDSVRVATPHGILTVRAAPYTYLVGTALAAVLGHATSAVIILLAALLAVRRPGWMAVAFWFYAIAGIFQGDFGNELKWLPDEVGLPVYLAVSMLQLSGFALIAFALRFPSGTLAPRYRPAEIAAWTAFAISGLAALTSNWMSLGGYLDPLGGWLSTDVLPLLPLVIAGAILVAKHFRSDATERAQSAWAVAGVVGSIAALSGSDLADSLRILVEHTVSSVGLTSGIVVRLLASLAHVFPLLAIYPILRYRLFDLGFVLNRTAVFSALTIAAVATLAGINWLAQHFVTERLSFFLQPVAAIVIGLGYLRIRGWTQTSIEQLLFRERFAAEEHLAATMRGLAFVERADSIDRVLVDDVAATLNLRTAALFRLSGDAFRRVTAIGWEHATFDLFATDDSLARRLLADGEIVRLSAARWRPAGMPEPPGDPVIALGVVRRGTVAGIVLYSRHVNGTEIDPEELRLLRRLAEAAGIAYETADAAATRARVVQLEQRVRELEASA